MRLIRVQYISLRNLEIRSRRDNSCYLFLSFPLLRRAYGDAEPGAAGNVVHPDAVGQPLVPEGIWTRNLLSRDDGAQRFVTMVDARSYIDLEWERKKR